MTRGKSVNLRCPHCGHQFENATLLDGTGSDSEIVACPKCNGPISFHEGKSANPLSFNLKPPKQG